MEHLEIKQALSALLDEIAQYTPERNDQEVCTWLMGATFRIWGVNELYAEEYRTVLPVFTGQTCTPAQVTTALSCAGEPGRTLEIPGFFRSVVARDVTDGTTRSRNLVDAIGRFLVLLALVNGDFTLEEAGALKEICALLLQYCDRQWVRPGKNLDIYQSMVTPKKMDSYRLPPQQSQPAQNTPEPPPAAPKVDSTTVLTGSEDAPKEETEKTRVSLSIKFVNAAIEKGIKEGLIPIPAEKAAEPKPTVVPASQEESLESVLAQLDTLVGLEKVKGDVHSLLNFIRICQIREERGMKVPAVSHHLVFTGNPGTGKTTVARMVARLYYLMGILPQGQLVETDRSGLVAGYVGQTAIKTQKVIQEALGGVLFIDEAYALANDKQDSYGKEAIETILKAMEDHRDELVVIVAGYDHLMHEFIDSNPGLHSRFNKYFHFADYDGGELMQILHTFCHANGYQVADSAIPRIQAELNRIFESRNEHFGNARSVRNLFEHAINRQADRLVLMGSLSDQDLCELTWEDLSSPLEVM